MQRILSENNAISTSTDYDNFVKLDIRLGTIIDAKVFPEARNPAYKLMIDFGPVIGVKKSSAQITENYSIDSLKGKQILAVVNFPPRQIGPFMSDVLVLGVPDAKGHILLANVDGKALPGSRLA